MIGVRVSPPEGESPALPGPPGRLAHGVARGPGKSRVGVRGVSQSSRSLHRAGPGRVGVAWVGPCFGSLAAARRAVQAPSVHCPPAGQTPAARRPAPCSLALECPPHTQRGTEWRPAGPVVPPPAVRDSAGAVPALGPAGWCGPPWGRRHGVLRPPKLERARHRAAEAVRPCARASALRPRPLGPAPAKPRTAPAAMPPPAAAAGDHLREHVWAAARQQPPRGLRLTWTQPSGRRGAVKGAADALHLAAGGCWHHTRPHARLPTVNNLPRAAGHTSPPSVGTPALSASLDPCPPAGTATRAGLAPGARHAAAGLGLGLGAFRPLQGRQEGSACGRGHLGMDAGGQYAVQPASRARSRRDGAGGEATGHGGIAACSAGCQAVGTVDAGVSEDRGRFG
jgi:hypothetical protein